MDLDQLKAAQASSTKGLSDPNAKDTQSEQYAQKYFMQEHLKDQRTLDELSDDDEDWAAVSFEARTHILMHARHTI